jgi:hypothetical protein
MACLLGLVLGRGLEATPTLWSIQMLLQSCIDLVPFSSNNTVGAWIHRPSSDTVCPWYQKETVEAFIEERKEWLKAIHPVALGTSNNPGGAARNSVRAGVHPRELRSAKLDGNGLVWGRKFLLSGDAKLVKGSVWYCGEVAVVIRQRDLVFALNIAVSRREQRLVVGGRLIVGGRLVVGGRFVVGRRLVVEGRLVLGGVGCRFCIAGNAICSVETPLWRPLSDDDLGDQSTSRDQCLCGAPWRHSLGRDIKQLPIFLLECNVTHVIEETYRTRIAVDVACSCAESVSEASVSFPFPLDGGQAGMAIENKETLTLLD